jgi:5-methylcytosine-specific restriction protein B
MSFEPEKITKEHVLEAIRLIKTESKSLIPSTGYDVIIDGIAYPPKEVMRYAHYIMNGESSWEYSGGESTNSFLSKMGFKIINKFQREHGRPLKLIVQYKKLLNDKQFEGETYKWEFTKLYHHRPNVQALDFNKEIQEINFSNLIYYTGI